MATPVKLYVYDLSNGLARQLSRQLTGKQIDGIWHTSVVVFGKEIFYGQGVAITNPGQSHHGRPLQIIDMGETAIDEDTFNEYLSEMRQVYTADKYHLLDFNCNSFTSDVVSFLTGGSIPSWIKDLPKDFLSTPFGAALRPTIDQMFNRPVPGTVPAPQAYNQPLASSLLQSVANRAAGPSTPQNAYLPTPAATPPALPATQPGATTVVGTLQLCSNMQHFRQLLASHRAVATFFTSQTCPPCIMVEPVFERLAEEKASQGFAFVKVDLGGMMTSSIANAYGVRATPTFIFFLDGQKVGEVKGANVSELRSQVDFLIFQAFPPHPHVSKDLPMVRSIPLEPILFKQVPALDTVQGKLFSFIDASPQLDAAWKAKAKDALGGSIIPFLKARFGSNAANAKALDPAATKLLCEIWRDVTSVLVKSLASEQLFPLVDLWRLGLLEPSVAAWCASASVVNRTNMPPSNPVFVILNHSISSRSALPKPFLLTLLRMLSNTFSDVTLARTILNPSPQQMGHGTCIPRQDVTSIVVSALLHDDQGVRTAAASVAFNIAVHSQKPRFEAQRGGRRGESVVGDEEGEGDWEVEIISAVLEAVRREKTSEDVVHRLTASLAFLIHLSPFYESQLKSLLEVLQAQDALKAKLSGGSDGFGENGVTKKDVRKLVEEVSTKLCD